MVTEAQLAQALRAWAADESVPFPEVLASIAGLSTTQRKELYAAQGGPLERPLARTGTDESSILLLPDQEDDDTGLSTFLLSPENGDSPKTTLPAPVSGERYVLGEEIGAGGLGRVLAAVDRVLGREVAVKEMIRGTEHPGLLERFLREGQVAGRLMHPNIVPIFDVGVRETGGKKMPYFAMGRIRGRDLSDILQDHDGPLPDLSRPRLLAIFQDVCLAIAYAHDHGVIHRDLKPANVMVGDYGEVYVVDWGLAKLKGQAEEPLTFEEGELGALESDSNATALTMAGDVLGTPAYMPPEQALGRTNEIDERSDIYSLGAILDEILTFHPPFEGPNALNILAQAMKGEIKPPSERVREIQTQAGLVDSEEVIVVEDSGVEALERTICIPTDVPAELEEIVCKAMAAPREDRYQTVRDLYQEIQLYLEGEKQRERNRIGAEQKMQEGRVLLKSLAKLRIELVELGESIETERRRVKGHWPVEKKRRLWELEGREVELHEEIVGTFTRAGTAFTSVFNFEPGNPDARAELAGMYWEQYLREEANNARAEMIIYENLVRAYNDGQYDDRLLGDGEIEVLARAFPCACLSQGRLLEGADLTVNSVHLFSGREVGGDEDPPGECDFEPTGPVKLKMHGRECRSLPLDDVDVWLFRYEEENRLLLPRFPSNVTGLDFSKKEVPGAVLDACFDPGSPYRPGEGLYLGQAPVASFRVPMGSYLLVLAQEDYRPMRVPVQVGRLAREKVEVTLHRREDVPPGFIPIPQGTFFFQGDPVDKSSGRKETKYTYMFFLSRFPVTCREYLAYINDLALSCPEEAARRVPRAAEQAGAHWPCGEDDQYVIPTQAWLEEAQESLRDQAKRLQHSPVDWEEDWPVVGVSWDDAVHYAAWRREREGLPLSLPFVQEWEKAARGVDARFHPWGDSFDPTFCNMNITHEQGMRPLGVDSQPSDESPYGVRGLGGNAVDPCLNLVGKEYAGWRYFQGGSWGSSMRGVRSAYRLAITATGVYPPRTTIRLACRVRVDSSDYEELKR
jgi:serine/threonine protein kinase/formylglycine-generating enzyme required for sulfatase activity